MMYMADGLCYRFKIFVYVLLIRKYGSLKVRNFWVSGVGQVNDQNIPNIVIYR